MLLSEFPSENLNTDKGHVLAERHASSLLHEMKTDTRKKKWFPNKTLSADEGQQKKL